jgi:O-antigen biosynthesis protein
LVATGALDQAGQSTTNLAAIVCLHKVSGNLSSVVVMNDLDDKGATLHALDKPEMASIFTAVRGGQSADTLEPSPLSSSVMGSTRLRVRGKFLSAGDKKFYIRGVTYGAFRPDGDGNEYHRPEIIERDFAQMAANDVNVVRIPHTMPPRLLLDAAQRHGLRVIVGLSAEQYVGYLIDKKGAPDIAGLVRAKVHTCTGHPALLCYAIGNEIPASMVRWLGRRPVERYLERLYWAIKAEDPDGLVTYVNYPSTEYLQLPFLDVVCFNVYLEAQEPLEAYLARLHTVAGDRPLILSEIGLDSLRHGEDAQARTLGWQIRTAFAAGCGGAIVFTWTDEWYRAGADVDDWKFGVTDRDRRPKAALATVRKAFSEVPFAPDLHWPRTSVVVCSHNGARTIRDCLEGLRHLEYPDCEVIVVDDGSTDRTAAIAAEYGVRLISTENGGLSRARNIGMEAATGEIVAYLDDDASPDPHWLTYLAAAFLGTTHAAVGGPNIAPAGDGPIADCVANAPGNPMHVLLSDREAEHIPGCNMALRKACLQAIGGFDPRYRVAGDDVDVCWRLRQHGWTLGFSPAATVWHHRRNSLRAYWKQQYGYGKAEALLERNWPEKYNAGGYHTWSGRVYGKGLAQQVSRVRHIYQGVWGSAPFQSLYEPAPSTLWSLALMPEWYLVILAFGALSALGILWRPLLPALLPLALAVGALLVQAWLGAARASFTTTPRSYVARLKLRALTAVLYLFQPLARLRGRLSGGLSPWRAWSAPSVSLPRQRSAAIWTGQWQAPAQRLHAIEAALRSVGARVRRGGDYDRWDLEVRGGSIGASRMLMAVEEHGGGAQLIRFRSWPQCSATAVVATLLFATLSILAALDYAWVVAAALGVVALLLALGTFYGCATATHAILRAIAQTGHVETKRPACEQSGIQMVEMAERATQAEA